MATAMRRSALAGIVTATAGAGLAIASLVLTVVDSNSPPPDALSGLSREGTLGFTAAIESLGLVTFTAVSAVIVWRRPKSRLSWAMVATMLCVSLVAFTSAYTVRGLVVAPGSLPLADAVGWTRDSLIDLVGLGAVGVILLFPDGRLMSARWTPLLIAAAAVFGAHIVANFDSPYAVWVGLTSRQPVPVTVPPALWPVGATLSWASGGLTWAEAAIVILVGAAVLLRLARTRGEARQQMKWFAYAAALYCLTGLLAYANRLPLPDWVPFSDFTSSTVAQAIGAWSSLGAAFTGMVVAPIAIAAAMLRYRLYDIDIVISRTIVYAGLALFVTASYAIVVGGVSGLLGLEPGLNPALSVITIALLAVLLLPVRSRLHDLADVAVYGRRAKPYDVLSDFAESIGRAEPAAVVLPRMADLLRQGTGASATEVWASVGERLQLAAASPTVPSAAPVLEPGHVAPRLEGAVLVEPVFHDGKVLGALVVVKPRGEELTAVERRLFRDLASQAGLVLDRFRLVQELRESRSRIVASQDAERYRIERNLHDGAQQRFVNALLALGMAQADGNSHGDRGKLLTEASREVQAGLNELRSLARGLQPPLLNEAGIVAAASALADTAPITTNVVADQPDRRYPQGIETAAYFVVAEALTNAVKHSGATAVEVRISESENLLRIEVADDGVGGADVSRGTGIIGLQDRVAAVGGRLTLESPPRQGTVVRAELPCR
jgi:signal transduction histidine kinase